MKRDNCEIVFFFFFFYELLYIVICGSFLPSLPSQLPAADSTLSNSAKHLYIIISIISMISMISTRICPSFEEKKKIHILLSIDGRASCL